MSRFKRVLLLLLCVSIPYVKTIADLGVTHRTVSAIDFEAVYCGARYAMEHIDPYDRAAVLRKFEADGARLGTTKSEGDEIARTVITTDVYPPTALLVAAPLAAMPWGVARALFLNFSGGLLVLAAFLVWDLAEETPAMAGWMGGFVLLNSMLLLWFGNLAGIVTSLCVIAAWCFLKERFALAGVVMLAVALAIKPHDAGFVWLYFLLAGGMGRKRALQTLALAAVLGMGAVMWVARVSPHWVSELHSSVAMDAARGAVNDPGPTGLTSRGHVPIISLQTDVSIFRNDPRFYNPVAYFICGALILVWGIVVLRRRFSKEGALFSLATVSGLTLLPVYHRTYDAKLLLLMIPACTLLWAGGGARRWVALGLTSAAIFVTSDIPLIFLNVTTGSIAISPATAGGKLLLLVLQPAPVVLLATGCFYLWVYIRYEPAWDGARVELAAKPTAAAGT